MREITEFVSVDCGSAAIGFYPDSKTRPVIPHRDVLVKAGATVRASLLYYHEPLDDSEPDETWEGWRVAALRVWDAAEGEDPYPIKESWRQQRVKDIGAAKIEVDSRMHADDFRTPDGMGYNQIKWGALNMLLGDDWRSKYPAFVTISGWGDGGYDMTITVRDDNTLKHAQLVFIPEGNPWDEWTE